jgi:HAE1 family hydrophobic/amphiphilic exporter-1
MYTTVIKAFVRRTAIVMLIALGLAGLTGVQFTQLPTGFLPTEDQGYMMVHVQLPDASSLGRTNRVLDKVDTILKNTDGVKDWVTFSGYSVIDGTASSNNAAVFVTLDPWAERQTRLGVAGGFQFQLEDRGGAGLQELNAMVQEMVVDGNAQSGLAGLNSTFRIDVPQLFAEVDRTKAKTLGIPLSEVFGTLQAYLGSAYVNDFNKFGRTWQVTAQADHQFRLQAEDIRKLEVRNESGNMVPIGTLVSVDDIVGPQTILRYNLYPTASITGQAAPGFSSGQSLNLMEELARNKLPSSMGFEWTGMSYQEKQVGSEAILIFALAILLVFLVLSAQYESWTMPTAVIMVVPLAVLGTVIAVMMKGADNNVYTQIGITLLIGLASKNAILIIEFALAEREKGKEILDAAVDAARLRFRPILMTSIASVAGFMPLVIASGAGAASQQAIGAAVVGGMIAATIMSLTFTPVFYVVMQRLSELRKKSKDT